MKQLARLGRRFETENVRQAWQSGGAFDRVRRAEIIARDDTISGFFFIFMEELQASKLHPRMP